MASLLMDAARRLGHITTSELPGPGTLTLELPSIIAAASPVITPVLQVLCPFHCMLPLQCARKGLRKVD